MSDRAMIKRLASDAGIDIEQDTLCRHGGWEEPMERFAQLVAQHCAERAEEAAARHEDDAQHEETDDLKHRQVVYARHIRHAAGAVRLDFGLPLVKGPRPEDVLNPRSQA